MSYNPQVPPQKAEELLPFLQDEFFSVARELTPLVEGQWKIHYELPARLKPGMVLYLDGVGADPLGTGLEGIYIVKSTGEWTYLG